MKQTATQTQANRNTTISKTDAKVKPNIDIDTRTDSIKTVTPVEQNFYDFYLNEHKNIICRRLHFAGSSFGLLGLATALKTRKPAPLLKGIVAGYACAWVGHFFFEKNKPATFKYPLQSVVSDFRMYGDVLRGNLSLRDRKFDKIGQK